MARNRKFQSAAIRFGPALKATLLCLLIGGSALGYVWQKDQIGRLGKQIAAKEKQLKDVERQNEMLAKQWNEMRRPMQLEQRIKELNLGLARPQPSDVWLLPEPPAEPASTPLAGTRQYAARLEKNEAMP